MRSDIEFDAEGRDAARVVVPPGGVDADAPTVVMAHGFSAVKEMYLDAFAERFAAAGLAALVFDNRNFGASDGEPRQEIDPWAQVRDYRHAITFAATLPEVDADRIGVWGSSYSGGARARGRRDRPARAGRRRAGAADQRLAQRAAPRARRLRRPSRAMFDADREARFRGEPPAMVPVVAEDPLGPSALPTPDSFEWFTETGRTRAPSWRNEVTLRIGRDAHRVRARHLHRRGSARRRC